jgi:hypothetical protein
MERCGRKVGENTGLRGFHILVFAVERVKACLALYQSLALLLKCCPLTLLLKPIVGYSCCDL